MKRIILISTLITLMIVVDANSQTLQYPTITETSDSSYYNNVITGVVLDIDRQIALPYTNIYVLHRNKGVISNEKGHFSINIDGLDNADTIRFQYIGFKTQSITIGELDTFSIISLKEEIINLSEALIFGSTPNARSIVKKVLQYKDSNYRKITSKNQTFIRERSTSEFDKVTLDLKKSSITQLDENMIKLVEEKIPRKTISYTDFLGNIYHSQNQDDSLKLKIDPIRVVSLKEKDIADLDRIEKVFEDVFKDINEKEYWKVKSGIFGQKIDNDEFDEPKKDSLQLDSIRKNNRRLYYLRYKVENQLEFSLMDDKKQWEFLHSTGKYNYTLVGGASVVGEDVYIIDFTPRSGGKYIGRMYISLSTYALIRADYDYAEGKTGRDIHLLGIGYTENQSSGSIYFEKKDDHYVLKYFSQKTGINFSFDRNVALLKKRKRFLFDKKLNEIKVGFSISANVEESIEYLVLDYEEISHEQFADFEQKKHMDIIYVDKFDNELWKDFSIIEPTQQMREYRKQEVDFDY